MRELDVMRGKLIVSVSGAEPGSDEVVFTSAEGWKFRFYHSQDCCECVLVEEVHGDIEDIVGGVLVLAEEVSNEEPEGCRYGDDSHTWTFYRFGTSRGVLTIRWLGQSNGYYSESVDFDARAPRS